MLDIQTLRTRDAKMVTIGSHPGIIQSILDFDFLCGKTSPSVVGIIATGRRYERYFFGKKEVLIPVFQGADVIPDTLKEQISLFINLSSARRTLSSTLSLLADIPGIKAGSIFAENVPERHAITLWKKLQEKNISVFGPASVGILIPNMLKLGAIGGVDIRQLVDAQLFTQGSVAVFSASGGMTNELINIVIRAGKRISFALSFGGDRFPLFTPKDAFLTAQHDSETEIIVYYGELGGVDEYELVELIKNGEITKPIYCYIGGSVSELFSEAPQFGHAKAMAKHHDETAVAKREALKSVGVHAADSFGGFVSGIELAQSAHDHDRIDYTAHMEETNKRQKALVTSSISEDDGGVVKVLGEDLLTFSKDHSFAAIVTALFLGKKAKSEEVVAFVDFVLRLLVDHGPHVSGAVNTIVTSRAGRDLVSSLASGLLTVGPRFGGAINEAAANWIEGVRTGISADEFVEQFASRKKYILGIGHRKYRSDNPDPRVQSLLAYTDSLEKKRFTEFALSVEKVTTAKKGNLILNVDGTIAAVLLDLLSEKEGYSDEELIQLTEIEFFNALFVLSRSVGFTAHFLDQKRLDEGLFRLSDQHVLSLKSSEEE